MTLDEKIKEQQEQLDQLIDSTNASQAAFEEITDRLDDAERKVKAAEENLNSIEERISKAEDEFRTKESTFSELNSEIDTARETLSKIVDEIKEPESIRKQIIDEATSDAKRLVAGYQDEQSELLLGNEKLRRENRDLKITHESLVDTNIGLSDLIESKNRTVEVKKNEERDLIESITNLTTSKLDLEEKISDLSISVEACATKLQKEKQELEAFQKLSNEVKEKLETEILELQEKQKTENSDYLLTVRKNKDLKDREARCEKFEAYCEEKSQELGFPFKKFISQ